MGETQNIRVMIVDDHDRVREGLTILLNCFDDLHHVGSAHNAEAAIKMCEELRPDVILMDMVMPGKDGIYATTQIIERYPQTKIIALTSFDTKGLVEKALEAGAISYLKKNVEMDRVAEVIRAAYVGEASFSPEAIQEMRISIPSSPSDLSLSACEQHIMILFIRGLDKTTIVKRLAITPEQFDEQVSNLFDKLSVSNRAEAVSVVLRDKPSWAQIS